MKISRLLLTSLISLAATTNSLSAQTMTAADFQPISRGGSSVIKEPAAVIDSGDVVTANSGQDAVLAALHANVKDLKNAPQPQADNSEAGTIDSSSVQLVAHYVDFPSGEGIVATGMSVYNTMPNPNASRIAQRNSFVIAYTRAKQAMVKLLGETSAEGRTILTDISRTIESGTQTTTSGATSVEESIRQAGSALLKGYVVFEVKEQPDPADRDVRLVFVTLASTPKTQKLTLRSGAMQSVDTLNTGLQNVLDEVQQGIVPPVGGRVITVPNTGESAVIGFGSALVRQMPTPALTARGKLTSTTISGARARDALLGMINGDKTLWSVGIPSKVESSYQASMDFSTENDPNAASGGVQDSINTFEDQFLSSEEVQDEVRSLRKGTLPPGIIEKQWYSEDGHWSYTMVVYYPAASTKAAQFAKSMREATLRAPVNSGASPAGQRRPRGNADVKSLKSGVVSPKSDL